jgi:hypothetical protein
MPANSPPQQAIALRNPDRAPSIPQSTWQSMSPRVKEKVPEKAEWRWATEALLRVNRSVYLAAMDTKSSQRPKKKRSARGATAADAHRVGAAGMRSGGLRSRKRENMLDPELCVKILTSLNSLHGWCSPQKAFLMADYIVNFKLKLAVEIGIFGGKSLVPVAHAIKFIGGGDAYGIEPWSNAVATETITNEANDQWWAALDMKVVKKSFYSHIVAHDLTDVVKVIEISSDEAVKIFSEARFRGKIEMLHIDGAHSEEQAVRDVTHWLPLIKAGGIIILDDIQWPTVLPAKKLLEETCEKIAELRFGENAGDAFAAFRVRL